MSVTETSLREWLVERVADLVRRPPAEIAGDVPMTDYGLDSVSALNFSAEIEDNYGLVLESTVMWDNPTIDTLAKALLARITPA